jgi:hypothetical protein
MFRRNVGVQREIEIESSFLMLGRGVKEKPIGAAEAKGPP